MDPASTNHDLSEPLLQQQTEEHSNDTEQEDLLLSTDANNDSSSPAQPSEERAVNYDPWKNHNVRLSMLLCVVSGVADSIWTSVILSGFLFALARAMGHESTDNTLVGAAEAVEGLSQLFTALPVGYMADVWGKAKVVRLGGVLMLLAIAITLGALLVVHRQAESSPTAATHSYYVMVGALALWGIVNGISFGPSQALFSDSIPRGQRSDLLTWLYTCYLLSSTVGPIVGIILLLTVSSSSEEWSLDEIYPVFVVGICLEIPAAIIMFFFSDKHTVPEGNDANDDIAVNQIQEESIRTQVPVSEILPQEPENESLAEQRPVEDESQQLDNGIMQPQQEVTRNFSKRAIPYVLFLSSLIVSLGSGASVKYFPLFFKELGLSSAAVQGIFLAVPVSISGLSFLGTSLGKKLGRIETSVLFDVIGTGLLYFMTWLSRHVEHDDHRRIGLIIAVYLLRTGIMNCTYPLLESILMDSVKSNERARWKSLESIASFGWTGSALVGGILSDKHSYQFTFAITATMQLIGGLLLLTIQPFVEPEISEGNDSTPSENGEAAVEEESD